jgi:Nucleotidyl transferase AbiEii toxin, Type IV TA system
VTAPPPWLTNHAIDLGDDVAAERLLWTALLELAGHLDAADWALIGGQMVALHGLIRGVVPLRTSVDIDIVANVVARRNSLQACVAAAAAIGLEARPSITGKRTHRFEGNGVRLDLLVPDHLPRHLVPRLLGRDPVSITGGQRALDRAGRVYVRFDGIEAVVVMPDLRGAIVLKARAAVADRRDVERHRGDIAFLCSLIEDPLRIAAELDPRERRHLRRCPLPGDPRQSPWIFLEASSRAKAVDAWTRLVR